MNPDRAPIATVLADLAANHRWTWHQPTAELLASLPGAAPDIHPATTVAGLDPADAAGLDPAIRQAARAQHDELQALRRSHPGPPTIAYVSAEYGLTELLRQYSGGLGILSGDHLKSASDLGLPLVAVGLFYRGGFFRQGLDANGQIERFAQYEPASLGLRSTGHTVTVEVGDDTVTAAIWHLAVGAIDLYLLDTDHSDNSATTRSITDRLYSGDQEHRIRQELILGLGGARALRAVGIEPDVVHLNEGHAGFWLLDTLATAMADGADFDQAVARTKTGTIFTTHTPVPAGIDRFPRRLITPYLQPWSDDTGVKLDTLFDLATSPDDTDTPKPFNMAAFCLALSGAANGVSKLHGRVSRDLFAGVPGGAEITSITNGVHARTWVDPALAEQFDAHLGDGWDAGDPSSWNRVDGLDDDRIVATRRRGRQRLIELVAERLVAAASAGDGHDATTSVALDPDALTVGFARRFATYKRADLILSLPDRLQALLTDDDRPIQFVFAGKAHPADTPGKALLAKVVDFARSADATGRFVFVPDYDMAVARAMYAGCDVWLNNPIRPREASGTSGEKSALNGGLQCSILDGWWDEMFDGTNGWAIPTSTLTDPAGRDAEEAAAVHDVLADEVVPLFYADGGGGAAGPSAAWIAKVRHAWTTLGPQVTSARMVSDYHDRLYRPALDRVRAAAR